MIFGDCQLQNDVANWLRGEGAMGRRSESRSTEDVWLRC